MQSPYRELYEDTFSLDSKDAPGGIVVYYADGDEEIIHVNDYVLRLFECKSVDEFLDYTQGSFHNFVYEGDIDVIEDGIWGQVAKREGLDHVYYRIRTKTGRLVTVADYGKLSQASDANGRPIFYVLVSEVTPEVTVDWLTGLPSMARFHSLARMGEAALLSRGEKPVAVSLDIMGMKSFNTRFGRDEGDALLRAFAEVLRTHFGNEACSRFAEDHFYAFAALDGIEHRLEDVFEEFAGKGYEHVPVRAGIYACDPEDDIVALGFDRAKTACDLDRKTWQSHFMWYTDEMKAQARLRNHVLDSLDEAIAEGWIRPYYQAIVRSATGDICNEEALARWIDPKFGQLAPYQFIPDLEEAGLLYKLDLHIVDCVVADMQTKRSKGVEVVPVSMNFSLRDLIQLDLAAEIASRADAAGLPRGLFRVELTESVASTDPKFLREQIDALHDAGFEVWMDDFGSGYSSLNALQEFNFDLIKLDMGFLRSSEVERSRIILAGVVQAAATLGVGTLTEGVETKEQAEFLASIGCDMLQGYYYAKPNELEGIINRTTQSNVSKREAYDELAYWNDLSVLSFTSLIEGDGERLPHAPGAEAPIAVLENRAGSWSILRANNAYIEFVTKAGVISESYSGLKAMPIPDDIFDHEFYSSAEKSAKSGGWERILGSLEYGTGFQFYIRCVASAQDVTAYMVSAIPNLLGAGLGIYGDVPVAYAVFRVELNEAGTEVEDARFVYANNTYCYWSGCTQDEIIGESFLESYEGADRMWLPYCYRAAVLGEYVHDVVYGPEVGHWLSVNVAPSLIEDCCVFSFSLADAERQKHEEVQMGLDTSDLIIRIADEFNAEKSYDVAMNGLLASMSEVIHPERLYIFERGETTSTNTFEWCAGNVARHIPFLKEVDNDEFRTWDRMVKQDSLVLIPDVEELRENDPRLHWQLTRRGVTHVLAVPLVNGEEFLGYLAADNYMLEEDLDSIRVLKTVASFLSSRIVNHRLMERLRRMGTYDDLTGMLNRRGIDIAVSIALQEHEGEPFALALMDIDDFKTVNDACGHAVGDEALRTIASVVERAFPAGSVVGRNGGDEFLAFVVGRDASLMEACLSNVINANLSCEYGGSWYPFTMSAGYACYPQQTDSLRQAYTKADAALYSVKLTGKNGFKCYSEEMRSQYRSQLGFTPRDIAENAPGALLVHAPDDGEILFANDGLVELFECESLAEFMERTGGKFDGVVYPEDQASVREAQGELRRFRILTRKGNVRDVVCLVREVSVHGVGELSYDLLVGLDDA